MSRSIKYILLYIPIYFIVDFATGFSWDFQYWLSVNGPILGLVVYSLSGLFFSWLIYKKNISEKKLFLIVLIYGAVLEIFIFHNSFLLTFPAMLGGFVMMAAVYSLIVFTPKWIVEKSLRENLKIFLLLFILWLAIAILAYFNNPHKI